MTGGNLRDLVGGALVTLVGLCFVAGALQMRVGSAMQMGPGYFPMLVGGLVSALGLAIVLVSFARAGRFETVHWRPMLAVLASITGFALVLGPFGLIPAVFVGISLAALGDRTSRSLPTLVLAVTAALSCWLVFSVGLGLQMPGLRLPAWLG
jgi:Tripartite tricarboxylate transporter TctB family